MKYLCVLVGNENKENIDFFISNNDAACSSIYDFSYKVKDKFMERQKFLNERKNTVKNADFRLYF